MNPLAAEALNAALAELQAHSGTIHVKAPDQKLLLLAAWAGSMPEPVLNVIREIPGQGHGRRCRRARRAGRHL